MKIASVVCTFPPYAGGIGNSAKTISQLLQAEYEVHDFTPFTTRPWLKHGHGSVLGSLLWQLKDFDYIYLHYPYFGTDAIIWLSRLFYKKPKLIIHYHMDVAGLSPFAQVLSLPSRLIRNSLLQQADLIVSASLDYIKHSQIKNYYAAHPEKFREIPFAIDLHKFQPSKLNRATENQFLVKAKEMVNFVKKKFIKRDRSDLLFVGGLDSAHYFKGVEILLRAIAGLTDLNFTLTIVGDGDRRSVYESLAFRLGLAKRVTFAGKLADKDLVRAYQQADLLILPSINSNEAFGIVLIEALACGVPVMASDLPGVRSVFTDGQEGFLVKAGDITDLEEKLRRYLSDHSLSKEMSLKARQLAETKYSQAIMSEKLLSLFK